MTQDEVIALMRSSSSEAKWDDNADKVIKACGGYPTFWWPAIIGSGLAEEVAAKWSDDAKIHVTAR